MKKQIEILVVDELRKQRNYESTVTKIIMEFVHVDWVLDIKKNYGCAVPIHDRKEIQKNE